MKTDSFSKNIQNQIANAQKQLQELSANETMNVEEKMKKRQEIQQQINDLNNQLRQHQIEQRKEKQQAKMISNDNVVNSKNKSQSSGLSQLSMTAMISAESAISTARAQNSVATKLETRTGVLETEIKLDASRGGNVESKMEELAEVKQRVSEIKLGQTENLADVNNQIKIIDEDINVSNSKTEKSDKGVKENNSAEDRMKETTLDGHMDVRI